MRVTISLAPTLSALGANVLLWACIALLIALSLLLVIISIFGNNRGYPAAMARHKQAKRKDEAEIKKGDHHAHTASEQKTVERK